MFACKNHFPSSTKVALAMFLTKTTLQKGAGTKGTGRQVIPVEKGTGKRRNCYKTTGKEVSGRKGTRTKCVENVTVEKVLVKIRGGRR